MVGLNFLRVAFDLCIIFIKAHLRSMENQSVSLRTPAFVWSCTTWCGLRDTILPTGTAPGSLVKHSPPHFIAHKELHLLLDSLTVPDSFPKLLLLAFMTGST